VDRGLEQTAELWPPVQLGFALVHQAAAILKNEAQRGGQAVQKKYRQHVQRMTRKSPKTGALARAVAHFVKVSASYWWGLFHCYDVPDLPRTNNGLEQLFGSTRHHERRCTGRKVASPSLVLRGSVRIMAGLGTRQQVYNAQDLSEIDLEAWRDVRAGLEQRRQSRTLRRRFRRDPTAYLHQLEERLLKPTLPT
jgi:hypothetical protein